MDTISKRVKLNTIESNSSEWITLERLAVETGIFEPLLRSLCQKGILPHKQTRDEITKVSRTEFNEWLYDYRVDTVNEIQRKEWLALEKLAV